MNQFAETTNFLSRPYAERQLIIVLSDEQMRARQEYKEGNLKAKLTKSVKYIAKFALPVPINLAVAAFEVYKGITKLREQGIKALSVSQSEAKNIKFPLGHPRFGVLYVGHPAADDVYFPFAQFHRFTFEHKISEAVRLLMSLGATYLEVQHVSGWKNEFSSIGDLTIFGKKIGVGGEGTASRSSDSEILFTAKLQGQTTCSVPDDLVWYFHEQTWKQIAEGRMKYGMKSFSLSIRYEDDLGINVNLKTAATKAKLDIGGDFQGHQSTVWNIVGEFS